MDENGRSSRMAYPEALEAAEKALFASREEDIGLLRPADRQPSVGFGLSGGGIRSATFSLGVFQALAALRLVRYVDYLSTVSGGGYFGSFLGRLFSRQNVNDVRDVEAVLAPDALLKPVANETPEARETRENLRQYSDSVLGWLRANGRYLAPSGSGDLKLAIATILRNWFAVQVVMGSFVLMLFFTAHVLKGYIDIPLQGLGGTIDALSVVNLPFTDLPVWGSSILLLVGALLVVWVIPLGWAYWLVSGKKLNGSFSSISPTWGAVLVLLLGVALAYGCDFGIGIKAACGTIAGMAFLTFVFKTVAGGTGQLRIFSTQQRLDVYDGSRNRLSRWLSIALWTTSVLLVLAMIDTLGKTIYATLATPDNSLLRWTTATGALSAAAAAFAQKVQVLLKPAGKERLQLPATVLANVAAGVLMLVLLTTIDLLSHGIYWEFGVPGNLPACFKPAAAPTTIPVPKAAPAIAANCAAKPQDAGGTPRCWPKPATRKVTRETAQDMQAPARILGVLFIFSLLFGRTWEFLNRSSLQSMYGSRLARAYLGASNPKRLDPDDAGQVVTETIPGDDIPHREYARICGMGGPIHLINVTINETVDGRSQVEQKDRHGVGMAIGPAGLSAGIRHHWVIGPGGLTVFPKAVGVQSGSTGAAVAGKKSDGPFRMFGADGSAVQEELSLGQWISISGAAVSTGLGSMTNIGLSLLTGFSNIRLGYWWDSGVTRPVKRFGRRLFVGLFPVQAYFTDEFTASFRGSSQRHWYLTDGGHFENLGGYELIRRRLPVIVLLDGEADADYEFNGLANLVRKARIDFDAEIRFLGQSELDEVLPAALGAHFGPLGKLRRGLWSEEPILDPNDLAAGTKRRTVDYSKYAMHSLAHAALAKVYYDGAETPGSWLIYLKTAVTGDEPLDLLQYHATHPSFPHESTAEQFFDEAQWESYRKLGEHIGSKIFSYRRTDEDGPDKIVPAELLETGARPQS